MLFAVSQNRLNPANSFRPLDFHLSHSNDTPSIIVLDSNQKPRYPVLCFRRGLANYPSLRPTSPSFATLFLILVGAGL